MSLLAAIASSRRRASVAYDTDAQSYFTAVEAVSSIGTVAKNAANALIVGLKADGLWTLIHQLYLYAGPNTLAGALVKARGSGTRVNNGFVSGDFSPTLGLQGNGTSKSITNGFLTNQFSANSHSIFVYSSSGFIISSVDTILCGSYNNTGVGSLILDAYTVYVSGRAFRSAQLNPGLFPVFTTGLTTSGSIMGSRTTSSMAKIYQDGIYKAQNTSSISPSFSNLDFSSFGLNTNGTVVAWSPDRRQVEAFTQGLDDTQAGQLHNRVTSYVNALNY